MLKIRSVLLALVLVAAPGSLLAQADTAAAKGPRPAHRGPIEMLLRQRESLGLTPAQVTRLEEIRARMDEKNRPIVAQLVEIRRGLRPLGPRRDMTPEQRAELERRMEQARPLMRQIRENNRAFMEEVGQVLTPEQKEQVRQMIRSRREHRDRDTTNNPGWRRRGRGG